MAVKVGSKVRDTLTGFEGVATARAVWLYGCVRIAIEPDRLNKDGGSIEPEWFDEQRVEVVKKTVPKVSKDNSAKSGGPQRDPRR